MNLWRIKPPEDLRLTDTDFIGVDPGTTHLGLAWTTLSGDIYLVQADLERIPNPVERMCNLEQLLSEVFVHQCRAYCMALVEGASYADRYRQVELAECRATVVWWVLDRQMGGVKIVPPLTIRKKVFGSAKLKAQDVWESEIPHDALAALSCLYYAYMEHEK